MTARVNRVSGNEQGVLAAFGGVWAGWALYIKDNRLIYEHNLARHYKKLTSHRDLPLGPLTLSYRFEQTGPGKLSGRGTLLINGEVVGEGDITKHVESGREGLDIGQDRITPAGRGYAAPFPYSGTLEEVVLD